MIIVAVYDRLKKGLQRGVILTLWVRYNLAKEHTQTPDQYGLFFLDISMSGESHSKLDIIDPD